MAEMTPIDRPALGGGPPAGEPPAPAPPAEESLETDRLRSPAPSWPPWTAPVALIAGLVLAALGAILVDLPALAFGVKLTSSHTPPGLAIADTFVQDLAFVLAAVYCARLGGRVVRSWQFGLRPPGVGWRSAAGKIVLLLLAFLVLSIAWVAIFHPSEEKLLEKLGTNEGTALLLLSAALTCVVAPICEEILFRGFIFTALRNWRGTLTAALIAGLLFGGVHAGSAPALDLVPLAALGFGLCLLYRRTGSLYPCFLAHALNNSIAFASLENWTWWQGLALILGAFAGIGAVVLASKRVGLIESSPLPSAAAHRIGA
jgi:membrane protease YdiL (CAAX protease family)